VARKLETVTLDSKIVNSRRGVGEQQALRSDHNRFACQSSGAGFCACCVMWPGPMTASSFPLQRKIARRSCEPGTHDDRAE
jgi:hypothetical protein